MIIPGYNGNDANTLNVLTTDWSNRSTREVLVRAIRDSFELYLGATEYLAMAMLLYQPKTAEIIKSSKSELFWAYTAESLFDSAALLAFNLYDKDKNLQFKNLLTLQRHIDLLPAKNAHKMEWSLDPAADIKDNVSRIENRRNKNIAHHERAGHKAVEWGDITIALEYAKTCIQKFHLSFIDSEYDFHSMYERAEQLSYIVFGAVGVEDNADRELILEQLKNFIETTKKSA